MWKEKPVSSSSYVNRLRERDTRSPEAFLADLKEDG